ncbi:MAG TPA: hypothetical protein P5060_00790 [Candidatus Absconditabacterales bacterium]|nr:hypothetical protein [Candidatus Absconditabacterales bacterium]
MSGNDLIKDKSISEFETKGVFDSADKKLTPDIGNRINEKVEESFQDFLNSKNASISHIDNEIEKDWYQESFNEWLDNDVDQILEKSKIEEIEAVNTDIENNLKALNFEIELGNLQEQIQQNNQASAQIETLTIGSTDIDIAFRNGIKPEEVAELVSGKAFEGQVKIIELLKEGKVKELQQKIGGTKGEQIGTTGVYKYDNLPVYGDDGLFGSETFEALKTYIKDNPVKVANEAAISAGQAAENTPGSAPSANAGANGSAVESYEEIGTNIDVMNNTGVEYKGCEKGDQVEIYSGSGGIMFSVFPSSVEPNLKVIKEDGKEKLVYKADFAGEDNFDLVIMENGKEVFDKTVSIDIKGDGTEKTKTTKEQEYQNIIDSLEGKWEDVNILAQIIEDLQTEFNWKEELGKIEDEEEKEEFKLKYGEEAPSKDRMDVISYLIPRLAQKNKELYLKNWLGYVANGEDKNGGRSEGLQNDYFKGNYTININGENITSEEFLKKLDKGKISNWYIIDFDVREENNVDLSDPNYLQKISVSNVVISDDKNFGKEQLVEDQEIQYNAESYGNMEMNNNVNSDRQAIKNILGIRGLFGRGGVNEEMSIATEDYETNNPSLSERKDLKDLKQVLMAFVSDNYEVDIAKAFKIVNRESTKSFVNWENVDWSSVGKLDKNRLFRKSDEKQLARLGELYWKYKNETNTNGDYFNKAMGLLENYFVRGLKNENGKSFSESNSGGLFESIYQKEQIGTAEGLIDPDKKRQALKSIFKEDYKKGNVLEVSFQQSDELKELEKIVKKVDLDLFFAKVKSSVGGSPMSFDNKWEDKLYVKYQKYLKNLDAKKLDDNDNPIVLEDNVEGYQYYNAVFDFVVSMGQGNQDIVQAVNSMKLSENIDIEYENDGLDEVWYGSKEEKQFIMMLCDINTDGKVDSGDRGVRMGLEMKNIYKSVKVDQKYMDYEGEQEVWKNIVAFTKQMLVKSNKPALLADLEKMEGKDLKELLEEFAKNPGLLSEIRSTLVNSPIPIEHIYRYGENASEMYVLPQIMANNVEVAGLEEVFEKEYNKLLSQGLKDSPEIRAVLKPMVYGAFVRNNAIDYGAGGMGLTLNTEKAGSFSLSLGYADVVGNNGGNKDQSLGIILSWGDTYEVSKNTQVSIGARTGISSKENLFVPIGVNASIKTLINENQLDENLELKTAKHFVVGANFTMIGSIPSFGGAIGFSQDKIDGLNRQYDNIKEQLKGSNGVIADLLNSVDFGNNRDDVIGEIEIRLSERFGKAKGDEIRSAAVNLYEGILYFAPSIDGVLDKDDPILTKIVHDVADSYALQWKNQAMMDAKGAYLENVTVGLQFLAGFYPIPNLGATVSWYKNLYATETEESLANYYAQLATGRGMEKIDVDGFYDKKGAITSTAVEYLNAKLSIAHPNIDTPDLNIKISEKNTEESEGGLYSDNAPSLCIPVEIYRYANINLDASVADYTNTFEGKDGVEYLEVPLNTQIALLDYSRTNSAKFDLIIGDTKAELDDVHVGPDLQDFDGNPTEYKYTNNLYMDSTEINEQISSGILKDIEVTDDKGDVIETIKQPIKSCISAENGRVMLELEDLDGKHYVDMGGKHSDIELSDGYLSMPEFGTLDILYENGDYKLYYRSNPIDALNINFDAKLDDNTNNTFDTIGGTNYSVETIDFASGGIDLFEKYNNFDEIFEDIEDELSKMDDKYGNVSGPYVSLMNAAAEAGINNLLDETDYDSAMDELVKILSDNNSFKSEDIFDDLRSKIFDDNKLKIDLSMSDKVMIIDRFKAIFSYHIDMDTYAEIPKYGDGYMKLFGYDNAAEYPLGAEYKGLVLEKLKTKNNISRERQDNLFGMTAFYRLGQGNEGRGFSMTQMGSTNVLGGVMENIKSADLEKTQTWFLNNLEKSQVHKEILKESLVAQIDGVNSLNDEQLMNLLRGEQVDIDGKKVTLDLDYVFYLLGECANESIGIKINKIKISTPTDDVPAEVVDSISGDWEGGNIKIGASSHTGMYVNTVESTNEFAWARKNSAGGSLVSAFGKEIPEPEDKPWSEPNPGDEPSDDPWSGPGEGENIVIDDNSTSGAGDSGDGLGHGGNHGT